jgi:hypothetical protein
MPRFRYEPGRLSFVAHLSATTFVDSMRADKTEGRKIATQSGGDFYCLFILGFFVPWQMREAGSFD